ncbi:hypothetical protein BJX61DRAFT_542874 [Aspergillus egyptiacus]|nr:hypothetical protein BJX61DRAFT_542874 [Aspergillus egyptiacus]
MVRQRRAEEAKGNPDYVKPNDLFQRMMDGAKKDDGQPDKLAHRQLLLSLASIHTTSSTTFASIPRWRLEEDHSQQNAQADSSLNESQCINPPSLCRHYLGIQLDCVERPDTLGQHLLKGTQFSMPSTAILQDNGMESRADQFDGFRYYNKRLKPKAANKHQFAITDNNNFHVGHGKYPCPGRFFAPARSGSSWRTF